MTPETESPKPRPKQRKPASRPPAAPDRAAVLDIVGRNMPPEVRLCMIVLHYEDEPVTLAHVRDRAALSDGEAVRAFEFMRYSGLVCYDGQRYALREG